MANLIERSSQFDKTPSGWADLWLIEMKAAQDDEARWQERGDAVVKRFVDDRDAADHGKGATRVNLFTSNVQTLRALLYGKTPQVDVKRRFADPGDDGARTAGEMLQRMLNMDIERDDDTYAEALENALSDRLLPGLGVVRCRYEVEWEDREVPAIMNPMTGVEQAPAYTEKVKKEEDVEVDYVHWKDFRWSPVPHLGRGEVDRLPVPDDQGRAGQAVRGGEAEGHPHERPGRGQALHRRGRRGEEPPLVPRRGLGDLVEGSPHDLLVGGGVPGDPGREARRAGAGGVLAGSPPDVRQLHHQEADPHARLHAGARSLRRGGLRFHPDHAPGARRRSAWRVRQDLRRDQAPAQREHGERADPVRGILRVQGEGRAPVGGGLASDRGVRERPCRC